ncbi:MAG: holin family protein [Nitrospirota bacterium]|nr:holin family protein [Nitrospirota bacterium]
MIGDLFGTISRAIEPLAGLIDSVHTSEEERLEAKRKLFALQSEVFSGLMSYEQKLSESRATIIQAEAQGQSGLQRNWRPVSMLTFLILVVCDSFGWLPFRLADEAWTLLQIGMGGYVVGRSVEKIAPELLRTPRT